MQFIGTRGLWCKLSLKLLFTGIYVLHEVIILIVILLLTSIRVYFILVPVSVKLHNHTIYFSSLQY